MHLNIFEKLNSDKNIFIKLQMCGIVSLENQEHESFYSIIIKYTLVLQYTTTASIKLDIIFLRRTIELTAPLLSCII